MTWKIAVCLLFGILTLQASRPAAAAEFTLFFSGGVAGELEPCG